MRLYTLLKTAFQKLKSISPLWITLTEDNIAVKIGSVLVQGQYTTLQPDEANTPKTKLITFPEEYSIRPIIVVGLSGVPEVTTCRVSCTQRTTTGFTLGLYASNTTNRGAYWIAIGKI